MKKIVFALLLLPAVSFAENINFVSLSHITADNGYESINGYSLGYQGVFGGVFALDTSYTDSQDDICGGCDFQGLSFKFAISSFDEGSFYLGAAFNDGSDINSENGYSVGYAKINGDGLDYGVSATVFEGITEMGVTLRAPIGDSGLGWQVGLAESDGVTTTTAGVSVAF
jgi:hypothetical protein